MSTFNAGAIEASLTLGRSDWLRDLRKTQKEIQDLENKTITIGVDADTDNAHIALDNLEALLDDFDAETYTTTVDVSAAEARAELDILDERLDRLDGRDLTIGADADITNALIQLNNLENEMDVLEADDIQIGATVDTARARAELALLEEAVAAASTEDINIDVDIDTGEALAQLLQLQAEIGLLDGQDIDIDVDVDQEMLKGLVGTGGESGGYLGLLRILIYALILLSPVLAVAMSAATAAIIGFTAAVAGAAGPVAILAGGLALLISDFVKAKKEGEGLTEPMQMLADALDNLSDAKDKFTEGIADAGFGLMAAAVNLLADVLPTLTPLFNATAEAVGGVLGGIRRFVESPEYQEMLDFFGGFGIDMLESFMQILGNLIRFFGRLFQAIEPFARAMMQGLEDVTAGWMEWADDLENNESFQKFMDNALEYGPQVLDMLGSLIQAFRAIGDALMPFAGPMLTGLTALFDLIADAPTEVLTALIAGFAGLWLGMSVLPGVIGLVSTGLSLLGGALALLFSPIGLVILAIAAIGLAIYELWTTNEEFRDAVMTTWNAIVDTVVPIVEDIVNAIRDNWGPIQAWAKGIWGDIKNTVLDAMIIIQQLTRGTMAVMRFLWDNFGKNIIGIARGFATSIGGLIRGFFQILRGIFQLIKGVLTGDWREMGQGLLNIGRGFITALVGLFKGAWQIWSNIWEAIGRVLIGLWLHTINGLRNAWNAFWDWIQDRFQALINFFRGARVVATGIWDGLRDSFRAVINSIIGWWNNLSFTLDIPDKIPGLPDSFTISSPNIPYLARGAYLTEPTLNVAGEGTDPEIVAPEPVLERIVRENGGADIDYGRLAAAIAGALASVLGKIGGITREDLERLIEAASVNLNIDARSDRDAASRLASAIGFQLRVLGYGGKANV